MRTVLAGVVVLAVILLVIAFYPGGGPKPDLNAVGGPRMLAGAPAQSFPVKRIDGKADALDRYRGQIVVLNLWATWCPPCREEMPALERLYREYRSKGLVVLGVDQGEGARVAASYARAHGVTYPILLDEDQEYGRAYAAVGLPTTIIVGRDGHIVKGIDGEMTLAQMREAVTPVLRAQ
jgi:cytochrome c biogenesis protein CcmG, thiol:disulfide interchange protein DsbE